MDQEFKGFAVELARRAGEIMRAHFAIGIHTDWKEDDTPLTAADLEINKMVVEEVGARFPEHGVLGEEQSHHIEAAEYVWVCDPIDGTLPFSHGLPLSTFCLALTKNGESILGVVYDPYLDRLFVGERGKGATLNGEPIAISKSDSFAHAVVNLEGFARGIGELWKVADALRSEKAKVPTLYSMAYSGILVASGSLIASVFANTSPWDIAAIKVIVEEAGGRVTDLYGNEQRYDRPIKGALVSNGLLHDRLLDMIRPALPEL